MNLYTIFYCAQLLERFNALQGSWFPFHKSEQRLALESINSLVTKEQGAMAARCGGLTAEKPSFRGAGIGAREK